MNRLTNHRARRRLVAAACLGSAILLETAATADVVQGTVTPANAKVVIKDGAGNQVSENADIDIRQQFFGTAIPVHSMKIAGTA